MSVSELAACLSILEEAAPAIFQMWISALVLIIILLGMAFVTNFFTGIFRWLYSLVSRPF
jgi:hypothetical protein